MNTSKLTQAARAAIAAALLAVLWVSAAFSQDLPPVPLRDTVLSRPPMQYQLETLQQQAAASRLPLAEFIRESRLDAFIFDAEYRVFVNIAGSPGSPPLAEQAVLPFGGVITSDWKNYASAWIPIAQLTAVAESLPKGYYMRATMRPTLDDIAGWGPANIGSDHYRDSSANGKGIVIAIIDGGFDSLTEARANGDVPSATRTTEIDCSHGPCTTGNTVNYGGIHGTACLETVYDHCPQARYRLYKVSGPVGTGNAVDDAIANGVDIISHSQSRYNQGWDDDTGPYCDAVEDAGDAGIIFFTSSGNRARTHYQGTFSDADTDGWHNYSGTDETINISMPSNGDASFYLAWDTSGGTTNYDLYLLDNALDTIIKAGDTGELYEEFWWRNTDASSQTVHLVVRRLSGPSAEFELFMHGDGTWQQYIVAANSNTSPSNSTHPYVISVGAVNSENFDSPTGDTGIIASYSSQGPSNSGMTLPDLCGVTADTGFIYGIFTGTSCATPSVAGAAGAFMSCDSLMGTTIVHELFLDMPGKYRDWGTTGNDNIYGRGGATAPRNDSNTVLICKRLNNTGGQLYLPFYYVTEAYDSVYSGGRMVFFDGSYTDTLTLNKVLTVENYGSTAAIGEP